MKYFGSPALLLLLSFSATANAQIILHGYPGKVSYASPAEWPMLSAQGHIAPNGGSTSPGHTHVECKAPIWSEYPLADRAKLDISCQIQLFHMAGRVAAPDRVEGELISKIVYNTPLPIVGDPNGVKVYTMTVTIDPMRSTNDGLESGLRNIPKQGWWAARLSALTVLDNGNTQITELWMPFFSVIDKTQPVPNWAKDFTLAAINIAGFRDTVPSDIFGKHVSQYTNCYPPILAPFNTPQTCIALNYAYAHQLTVTAPLGNFKEIADLDFHNGIPGNILASSSSFGGLPNGDIVTFNPATLGSGPHKIAMTWEQHVDVNTIGMGAPKEVWSLMVVTVNVGPGVPVPTTCQDPTANNVGQPLPCTFNPIPPVSMWNAITATFERMGDLIRVCAADAKCLILGTLVNP